MLEIQDLRDFSISNWYKKFSHISIKTIIINITEDLAIKFQTEDSNVNIEKVCSTEYLNEIKNAINSLDKNVFVKNNWHAPMDAKVFSFGNTLKVNNVADILLLFTVSNIIQEDFSSAKGVPFCFALKKWTSIHPAAEFRCVVINKVLRGITPRDWPTFYAHFKEEGPQIIDTITSFYNDNIKLHFPRQHYTFDVVLSYPDNPFVLDFGALNSKTNLYAFSWQEIQPLFNKETPEEVAPVFRYLESDIGIMTKSDALHKIATAQT